MSNKAHLDDFAAECREERANLLKTIEHRETSMSFFGTPSDPFGKETHESDLAAMRSQIADLDSILGTHDAHNG